VLVIEGSIPNENINGDGYWTSIGNDLATGEPITLNKWIGRPRAGRVRVVAGRHLRDLRRHPRDGRAIRRAAWASRLPRLGLPLLRRGCPDRERARVAVPGAAENFMETLTVGCSPRPPVSRR
jgi:hypothetical protein